MKNELRLLLKNKFGHEQFRFAQEEIISTLLGGESVLVLMPTGGGKSICFQLPALLFHGVTIVVSPLIALMKDQVMSLQKKGIEAEYLNSSQPKGEQRQVEERLLQGHIKLLYISPERLATSFMQSILKRIQISLWAIDEAHCISSWGHDFRPEYLELPDIIRTFSKAPVIALTATASIETQKEIIQRLKISKCFKSTFDRPNLILTVNKKQHELSQIKEILENHQGHSGIIYALSRKKTEKIASELQEMGLDAYPYHAGLSISDRNLAQESFFNKKGAVIVATVAFGMGIDKSDIRFVCHIDLPFSVENYYQEIGRAGRDGAMASAYLFYSAKDAIVLKKLLQRSSSEGRLKFELQKLESILGFAESKGCRREILLNYFSEKYPAPCEACDYCLSEERESFDGTQLAIMAIMAFHELSGKMSIAKVVDYLRAESKQKDGPNKVYGKGKHLARSGWYLVIRQLLVRGVLRAASVVGDELLLTDHALPLLNGEVKIFLSRKPAATLVQKAGETRKIVIDDDELFRFKEWRKKLAKKKRTKPFKVAHDRTLVELLHHRPKSLEDMESIYGIGPKKLVKYGAEFLTFLNSES